VIWRTSLVTICLAMLGAPVALAQPRPAVPRVGLLSAGTDPARPTQWKLFIDTLRTLGYVEGQTVVFERQFGAGHRERTAALAANLARAKPDLVVVTGSQETALAREAMPNTPIVFVLHPDPVGAGVVQSLSRPGGYITGVTPIGVELVAKRIELAKETFPALKRLARLADPGSPLEPSYQKETAAAARVLGVQVQEAEADRPEAVTVASLRVRHLDGEWGLRGVPVKGGKTQDLPLPVAVVAFLHAYVERVLVRDFVAVTPDSPLFWSTWGRRTWARRGRR
jgi:ABC-type uncharacterized transport system substrate-binding protein